MSDDVIDLPPRPPGRHAPDAGGMAARWQELAGVGPTVTMTMSAEQRRDRGVAFDGGALRIDIGMLLRSLLRECSAPEKQLLLRSIAREVRELVPEAADYLETWSTNQEKAPW